MAGRSPPAHRCPCQCTETAEAEGPTPMCSAMVQALRWNAGVDAALQREEVDGVPGGVHGRSSIQRPLGATIAGCPWS
jgi:hypothetical protein